jgi:hypothetical protein
MSSMLAAEDSSWRKVYFCSLIRCIPRINPPSFAPSIFQTQNTRTIRSDKRLMIIESEFAGALLLIPAHTRLIPAPGAGHGLPPKLATQIADGSGACIRSSGTSHQPSQGHFDRTEMANGFGNRFPFACVRRAAFSHGGTLPEVEDLPTDQAGRIAARGIQQISMAMGGPVALIPSCPPIAPDCWDR